MCADANADAGYLSAGRQRESLSDEPRSVLALGDYLFLIRQNVGRLRIVAWADESLRPKSHSWLLQ